MLLEPFFSWVRGDVGAWVRGQIFVGAWVRRCVGARSVLLAELFSSALSILVPPYLAPR